MISADATNHGVPGRFVFSVSSRFVASGCHSDCVSAFALQLPGRRLVSGLPLAG